MSSTEKSNDAQLVRFCLYGFLKNQQYFEPFLIIIFRDKGLSFTAIGALMAFKAVCVNVLEVPSGAMADGWGRRRAMIASMLAYIASFVTFALSDVYWLLFPAMFLFATGEAFRTGTHKAMIFDWLARQGRQNEKTKIYGLTRSWSKIGSALNVVIAAIAVIFSGSYQIIFWVSIIPFVLNVVNFMFYPKYLDSSVQEGETDRKPSVWSMLKEAFALCTQKGKLRGLIAEDVCFEGFYSAAKDYLQPLIKMAAVSLPIFLSVSETTRTAILVAIVFAALNLMSSYASRQSHRLVERVGGESRMSRIIWLTAIFLYVLSLGGILLGLSALPIVGFVVLAVLLNIWKPIFLSRFYDKADSKSAATTLSIASQSRTAAVVCLAPLLGVVVDKINAAGGGTLHALWPVAFFGIVAAAIGLLISRSRPQPAAAGRSVRRRAWRGFAGPTHTHTR